jgi:hypothetical protein
VVAFLIGKSVEAQPAVRMVELFHRGLVASHIRSAQPGRFTTPREHRPQAPRRHRTQSCASHETRLRGWRNHPPGSMIAMASEVAPRNPAEVVT